MTHDELMAKVKEGTARVKRLTVHFKGVLGEFNTAAALGDSDKMDQCRQQMHDALDVQLDTIASTAALVRVKLGGG